MSTSTLEHQERPQFQPKVAKVRNAISVQPNPNQPNVDNEPVRERRNKQMKLIMEQLHNEDFEYMSLSEVIEPLLENKNADSFEP